MPVTSGEHDSGTPRPEMHPAAAWFHRWHDRQPDMVQIPVTMLVLILFLVSLPFLQLIEDALEWWERRSGGHE